MLKRRGNPGRRGARGYPSRPSMGTQNEWKVLRLGAESSGTSSSNATTRSRISRAALLVKVTASTADGGTWRVVTMCAMRWVMTRVLPLPAPARISKGPSMWLTASLCCALSPLRKSMKEERPNFSTAPGQGSGWFLVLLVRATWKRGNVKGFTGGDLGGDGAWRNEANFCLSGFG